MSDVETATPTANPLKTQHEVNKVSLANQLRYGVGSVQLAKQTSNLFRDRQGKAAQKLDVRHFNHVLEVDPAQGWVEVEGMTTYADLVDATLVQQVMPCVVPQLKSITIGGAVSGIGIESSSFKYGLPHETVLEMDVLTGDGAIVTATPNNNHRNLFYAIPNSYGTLGYVLRLKVQTIPVKPYVELRHCRYNEPEAFFQAIGDYMQANDSDDSRADFLDGSVFGPDELYLTVGQFVDEAPYTSDYTYRNIYYQSIRQREQDFLTVKDYIWRWDTDWFWCSKHILAQNPVIRRLAGRRFLNSTTYTKIMRWNSRVGLTKKIDKARGLYSESVIQDVDIPLQHAPDFLRFFLDQIGITPLWTCPFKAYHTDDEFSLFRTDPATMYVNFGFWDVVKRRQSYPPGHFNRLIERKVQELGGIKSLYSDSYFEEDEFWRIYNQPVYDNLKSRYDPDGVFKNLYQKTVLRA